MRGDAKPLPIAASTPVELDDLASAIHDWWIDLDGVGFDGERLTIPLEAEGQRRWFWEGPPVVYTGQLTIHAARAFDIRDPNAIGYYVIRDITFARNAVTITAEPEAALRVVVDRIEVAAEPSPAGERE